MTGILRLRIWVGVHAAVRVAEGCGEEVVAK